MTKPTITERLNAIQSLLNPCFHPDQLDPDKIELAEELVNGLINELTQESEQHDPEHYRQELMDAFKREMPPERFAKILASLTNESLVEISVEYLSPPPTKYVLQITEDNNQP